MAGFRFKIAELEREILAMEALGKGFFDSETSWVLEHLRKDLQSIATAPEQKTYILELQCLRTMPSDQYDRRVGKDIHAVITGIWQLRRSGTREIEFCGKASTRIELYGSNDSETRLAMWRFELGAEDSPGCYIHAQILGDCSNPPFPKWLPIPRLPSIFITPMSTVEFVLGELFQKDWAQVVASNNEHVNHWRGIQSDRLQKLFTWYKDQIENAESSPWMALKKAKPEDSMFLPQSRRESRNRNRR